MLVIVCGSASIISSAQNPVGIYLTGTDFRSGKLSYTKTEKRKIQNQIARFIFQKLYYDRER